VTRARGNYAEVNGLNVPYEINGSGRPLVLLHGAYILDAPTREAERAVGGRG
jgi:pimeloyl-ACP methyl ester carboxylesterase